MRPSHYLLIGLAAFFIGGILAMLGTIREDAKLAPPAQHPMPMAFRRRLPRHGLCRLGVALMSIGAIGILASYFARM